MATKKYRKGKNKCFFADSPGILNAILLILANPDRKLFRYGRNKSGAPANNNGAKA